MDTHAQVRTTSHPAHQWSLVSTKTTQAGDTTYRWLHYRCMTCPVERHTMCVSSVESERFAQKMKELM